MTQQIVFRVEVAAEILFRAASLQREDEIAFPLFVFTGESNSGGSALNSDATAEELAPQPQVQILNNSTLLYEDLDIGTNNLLDHFGLSAYQETDHGLELEIANQVLARNWLTDVVYLCKTGQGGSTVAQWLDDSLTYARKFSQRTALAMQYLEDAGVAYRPVVFQSIGINDAIANTEPAAYKTGLIDIHQNIRSVLGSDTLIVMTLFGSPIVSGQENGEINNAILEVAADDARVLTLDTTGFAASGSHWSYAGMKSLAAVFRDAVLSNRPQNLGVTRINRVPPKTYLALWLDAADRGSFVLSSGKVATWYDKSGNARNAGQSTDENRPSRNGQLNGRPTVAFSSNEGTSLSFSYTGWQQSPLTIYVLYLAADTSAGLHTALIAGEEGGIFLGRDGAADAVAEAGAEEPYGSAGSDAGWRLVRYDQSGESWSLASNQSSSSGQNAPAYEVSDDFEIGAYDSGCGLTGEIAEVIIYDDVTDRDTDIKVQSYLSQKWGVPTMNNRLLRPIASVHPEAADWASRVRAEGGSVKNATLRAVSKFCADIDAAGIRSKIWRLNLLCGDSDASLFAVRTPLYRGPSRTGTQYGNTTDTNNAFQQADYTETGASGGLKGNGSSKYLDTGFEQSNITLADVHLSVGYNDLETSYGDIRILIGSFNSLQTDFIVLRQASGSGNLEFFAATFVNAATAGPASSATQSMGVRSALASATLYRDGSSVGTNPDSVGSVATSNRSYWVFGNNNGGSLQLPTAARIRMYSIGQAIDAAGASAFNSAVAAFNTALGRT
jgi:hypothetical protein